MASPITADHTLQQWLDHPEGGPLLREMLAASGTAESDIEPVLGMRLQQLVVLSAGAMPQSVVDELVLSANGGVMPQEQVSGLWKEIIIAGRFDGRTVIVTGAASGIGRATVLRLLAEGARVVAADIAQDKLDALSAESANERLITVAGDLSDSATVARIVGAAGPRIDGLANVAGINDDFSPLHEVSDSLWARVFAVNVEAVMKLTRAVLPSMLEAYSGSVVNVTSEAGLRGSASGVAYTASKHAVVGLTKSSAFMYAREGVRVNAIAPGGVATGIPMQGTQSEYGEKRLAPARAIMPSVAEASHLAASITFLLSDDSININGAVLPSDGGWSAA